MPRERAVNNSTNQNVLPHTHYDAIVIGSGHNGLISAAYLAAAGQRVAVIEKNDYLGGATTSQRVFPDYDAWLSRYSYLVSLLPTTICDDLGVNFHSCQREIASFTPYCDSQGKHRGLLMSNTSPERSKASVLELTGDHRAWDRYQQFLDLERELAAIAWPSLLLPLQHRKSFRQQLHSHAAATAWELFIENPLGEAIEKYIDHDVLRGLVMTDGKIGVLTEPHDVSLLQNRCFVYHVIGQGTGEWRVPVGGMQQLVNGLVHRGRELNVDFLTDACATHVELGHRFHTVTFQHHKKSFSVDATRVLVNAGPRTFAKLFSRTYLPKKGDEGSVIKVNMLLKRLPQVKAVGISPHEAFTGSFHLDESYSQMLASYQSASAGNIPIPPPAEMYCHSLSDNSILSAELQQRGFHTLTLFGLDMPYRLFENNAETNCQRVLDCYIEGLNRICAEPFEDCLATDSQGQLCIEIKTPQDLEREVDLDMGNIFHNQLSWFFTDEDQEVGRWGTETDLPRVYLAGSAAHRGGAVSGIPGRNAAMAILEELR